jgi:RNA polymerase sigma-70 factor (ECF subfamily)
MSEAFDREEAEAAAGLVRRIGDGDGSAEAELADRYGPGLSYLLRRLTADPALAEDLRQETLRLALEKARAGAIREPERLAGFLRATARNLAIAEFRRGRSRYEESGSQAGADRPDTGFDPLSRLLRDEEATLVRRLLAELRSDRDRQVLYRYYVAEEEKEAICRALGLGAVHFNLVLFRARERLRRLVQEARAGRGVAPLPPPRSPGGPATATPLGEGAR